MGKKGGKRFHRRKHFAPPSVMKEEDLKSHHYYGVISKYHGGALRNMDVTIFNAAEGKMEDIKATLKGSLRSLKCRQRITVGAYCLVEYGQVIMILKDDQVESIPESTYRKLSKLSSEKDSCLKNEQVAEDIYFAHDLASESESDSEPEPEDNTIKFTTTQEAEEEDLDAI